MKKILVFSLFLILQLNCSSQTWFEKSNFGGAARHRATSFSIGNFGYTGLGHINSVVDVEYDDFWKYDPASNSWSQIANYPDGPCFHATSFSIGNKGYVGTGRLISGSYSNNFYEYDPLTNIWTQLTDFPGSSRRGAVSFTCNNKGYVGTGQSGSGYTTDFYQFNPATNIWTAIAPFPGIARTSSVAFSISDMGYVGTGDSNSGSTNDFFQYNPITNIWTAKAPVGISTRQEASSFSVNGFGYIGSGDDYSSGNNYSDFWEYNPLNNTWMQIADFSGTARRYLSAFVIGNRAYAGTGTNGTNLRDFWMFDKSLSLLLASIDKISIQLYPNPSTDFLTIDFKELPKQIKPNDITIEIHLLSGELIKSQQLDSEKTTLNIQDLAFGLYIVELNYLNEPFKTSNFIKSL